MALGFENSSGTARSFCWNLSGGGEAERVWRLLLCHKCEIANKEPWLTPLGSTQETIVHSGHWSKVRKCPLKKKIGRREKNLNENWAKPDTSNMCISLIIFSSSCHILNPPFSLYQFHDTKNSFSDLDSSFFGHKNSTQTFVRLKCQIPINSVWSVFNQCLSTICWVSG